MLWRFSFLSNKSDAEISDNSLAFSITLFIYFTFLRQVSANCLELSSFKSSLIIGINDMRGVRGVAKSWLRLSIKRALSFINLLISTLLFIK